MKTEKQFKITKLSKICSYDKYIKLYNIITTQQKEKYPNARYPILCPTKRFYTKTNHREYYSKYLENMIVEIVRNEGFVAKKVETSGTKIKTKTGKEVFVKTRNKINKGEPDVYSLIEGKATYFEVKVGKDKLSKDQIEFIETIKNSGGVVHIIKTVDDFLEIYFNYIYLPF